MIVDEKLQFNEHVRTAVRKTTGHVNNLFRITVNTSLKLMKTLFISHTGPSLDYCSCVHIVKNLGDSRLGESVLRPWTGCVEGLVELDYVASCENLICFL